MFEVFGFGVYKILHGYFLNYRLINIKFAYFMNYYRSKLK